MLYNGTLQSEFPVTQPNSSNQPSQAYHPVLRLCIVSLLFAAVWLTVLPWMAERPSTRRYLERLDARGIDPAAMYYTELPPEIFLDALDRQPPHWQKNRVTPEN